MKNLMSKMTGMFQAKKEAAPLPTSLQEIRQHLVQSLAKHLSVAPDSINHGQPFAELGFDSLQAVRFSAELEDWLKIKLPPTLMWECPNVNDLANQLATEMKLSAVPA